jgi:hypothetical protein
MKLWEKVWALAVFATLGFGVLQACDTIIQSVTLPSSGGSPSPGASPTSPGCEAAVKSVRVNPFGYSCDDGVDKPANSSGLLPLGCTAHVTATPKDQTGKDVPDTVHGPIAGWSVSFGGSHVEVTPDPNQPFNVNVRATSVGEFSLETSVCNVRGAWAGRVVP